MHLTLTKNWLWGLLNRAVYNRKKPSDRTNLRKSLAVSYKSNIHLSFALAIPFLGVYPREMQTCPHKDLYMNVHSNIIHNSLNGRGAVNPQMSMSRWIDKLYHPYDGIRLSNKKWMNYWYNMDESQTLSWETEARHK